MIELRWFDRKVADPRKASLLDGTERVLQYRFRVHPAEWREWQDVPVVREEAA